MHLLRGAGPLTGWYLGYAGLWLLGGLLLAVGHGGQWLIDRRKDDS